MRKRVTLTIDEEVWAKCQEFSSKVPGVNWSQIAESVFLEVINLLQDIDIKESDPIAVKESNAELLSRLDYQYHQAFVEMYELNAKRLKLIQEQPK